MAISDRIEQTLERWSDKWAERLGSWAAHFVGAGIEVILDKMGKKQAAMLAPLLNSLGTGDEIPPELKPLLDEVKNPSGETAFGFGLGIFNKVVGSIKGDVFEYLTRSITRRFSHSAGFYLPDPKLLLSYHLRHLGGDPTFQMPLEELESRMRDHGIPPEETAKLIKATRVLFPSEIAIPLWLRDPEKYGKFLNESLQLGLDREHLEALKELAYKLPTAQEAITWMAHEVFEPDMIKKYGLDEEFGNVNLDIMNQIGIKPDQAKNYWRSHWEHASWSQMVAMLHRGALGESGTHDKAPLFAEERKQRDAEGMKELFNWFRLVEIPPYWRDGLINTAWDVPGRVEARMLAQYGLVDKAFLVELLARDGLAEEYRDIVADMMLVRGIRSDIQTRYTKKWINSDQVKAEITALQLNPKIADKLYQWIVTNAGPERTAPEKDLTAAEIIKGYKKNILDWQEAADELVALGYDETEAAYKLAIETEVVQDPATDAQKVQVDTIRRLRRQRIITKDQEVDQLLQVGVVAELAKSYADNDDLRLVKEPAGGA